MNEYHDYRIARDLYVATGNPKLTRVHDLKLGRELYEDSASGAKSFEIRLNDRDYRVDDVLLLRAGSQKPSRVEQGEPTFWFDYTGQWVLARVTYILGDGKYGVPEGYVIMGTKVASYGTNDEWKTFAYVKSKIIQVS
jgi:hypothetical protein